jgi:hypothetical protein
MEGYGEPTGIIIKSTMNKAVSQMNGQNPSIIPSF